MVSSRPVSEYAPLLAGVLALMAGLWATNRLPVGAFFDDALYVILAKALATGEGYRYLHLPGAPAATHYPPGYPAFLALLWRIWPRFPENVLLFKLANAACLSAAAVFACRYGQDRLRLPASAALGATLLGTITTPALYLSSMLLSEPFFLALLLPLLIHAERATSEDIGDGGWRESAILGACAAGLALVRTHGIAMVAAIAFAYAVRRRWREAGLVLGIGVLVLGPWQLWIAMKDGAIPPDMHGDYGSYTSWLLEGLRTRGAGFPFDTLRENAKGVVDVIASRLRPPSAPWLSIPASVAVLVLAAAGCVRLARTARVTLAFVACYLGIVLLWPFPPSRFVLGIWVVLMLLLAAGAQWLVARLSADERRAYPLWSGARPIVGYAAAALLLIGAIVYNVQGYKRSWWATTARTNARFIVPKIVWVEHSVDSSEVVGSEHDEGAVYLYTGRRAVPVTSFKASDYLRSARPESIKETLRQLTSRYGVTQSLLSTGVLIRAAESLGAKGRPLLGTVSQPGPWVFEMGRGGSASAQSPPPSSLVTTPLPPGSATAAPPPSVRSPASSRPSASR